MSRAGSYLAYGRERPATRAFPRPMPSTSSTFAIAIDPARATPAVAVVRVSGRLEFSEAAAIWSVANHVLISQVEPRVDFDLSEVTSVDGGSMALLVAVRHRLRSEGKRSEFVGAAPGVQDIVHLYEGDVHVAPRQKRVPESALSQVGRATT